MQNQTDYSLKTNLPCGYEEALQRVTEALKAEGFGILTEIDVRATMKKKLDVDFRKYTILGACNPPLAHRGLSAELDLGLLLPCNVIVYEQDSASVVSVIDPMSMATMAHNPEIEAVAREARGKLERVLRSLSAAS